MKVLLGAQNPDQRNKLAGWVASKNRYGNYWRRKVTPVNPQTSFQMAQRQQLGNLSSSWRGLTEAQRQSWIDAAPSFPYIDIFGSQIILAGNALFIALNKNLLNAGQSTIDSAPTPESIPVLAITAVTAAAGTPALTVTISPSTVPSGYTLLAFATPNIGPGIKFVKNRLRLLGTATATTGTVDLTTAWEARFGTLVEGEQIFVKLVLVSNTSGQQGVPVQGSAFVTA